MELEVRSVGGIESCFVSLPLPLIHALQSTSGGILPPVLALELRSRDGTCWRVAWSGSGSRSPALEVSKNFAECIALSDGTNVYVKVLPNLPRAVLVTIEPNDESDWEILELNSEVAEEAILKQVGIVHEGMRFPLWLHSHTVVIFQVISLSPEKSVVQLVPGTEVAVAPKRRTNKADSFQDIKRSSDNKDQMRSKGLLRVQVQTKRISYKFELKDFDLQVVLTNAALIHPETAQNLSFDHLQLVKIFPRYSFDDDKDIISRRGSYPSEALFGGKNVGSGSTTVNLLFSSSVAKGHLMLPESVCLFLKADLCSWVYVRECASDAKRIAPIMTLSPCRFKFSEIVKSSENNSSPISNKFKHTKNSKPLPDTLSDTVDWAVHEELISSISHELSNNSPKMLVSKPDAMRYLIGLWATGQLKAIASQTGERSIISSLVLSNETLFHFELVSGDSDKISPVDLFFLLQSSPDDTSIGGLQETFEFSLSSSTYESISPKDLQPALGKLEMGEPVSINTLKEPSSARNVSCTVSSLSWMEKPISQSIERLTVLLSSYSQKLLETFHLPLPGHILIHGPPGSGKTSLTTAIANYFEEHQEILAYIIFISCSRLSLETDQTIRHKLRVHMSEAFSHAPSLIVFDDLDFLFSSTEVEGSLQSNASIPLIEFLTDLLDDYMEKGQNVCGLSPIAFVGSAQSISKLPQSLCSSGRFDFHILLPAPATSERGAIIKHELLKRSMECCDYIVSSVASKCDGYDAYDLEILVDRAIHAASSRFLHSHLKPLEDEKPSLIADDFEQAMNNFVPVAMRGLSKPASEGGHCGWADVGGLNDVQKAIQEMIEFPSRFPNIFAQAPLRLRSNILLYGPPGCGKTHIVGAAAAACSLRFISIKGPELLNKYIGASEQAVRDLFSKANAAAPCLLFFDEFDSIAPQRGHDNTGVTDRVVNQLLTELDGVETLTGVFVFAATSRPDLLDPALLRPGRLDRLLFCGFPSWHERLDILKVLSLKLPLASDVSLEAIASMTEGFSGADLQALLSDSQLASVHELLEKTDAEKSNQMPVIGNELLKNVASKARPSISETEKQRLDLIYNNFLDSKKSMTSQSRDGKGKRATLA